MSIENGIQVPYTSHHARLWDGLQGSSAVHYGDCFGRPWSRMRLSETGMLHRPDKFETVGAPHAMRLNPLLSFPAQES